MDYCSNWSRTLNTQP